LRGEGVEVEEESDRRKKTSEHRSHKRDWFLFLFASLRVRFLGALSFFLLFPHTGLPTQAMCKVTPLPPGAATRSVLGQKSGGGGAKAASSKVFSSSSSASPTSFLSLGYAIIADFLNSNSEQAAVEKSRSSVPAPPPRKDGKLTMEHVAAHHRDGDAWVAIKGKVRD